MEVSGQPRITLWMPLPWGHLFLLLADEAIVAIICHLGSSQSGLKVAPMNGSQGEKVERGRPLRTISGRIEKQGDLFTRPVLGGHKISKSLYPRARTLIVPGEV